MSRTLNIKLQNKIYILILFISFSNVLFSQNDFPSVLSRLDNAIKNSNLYTQKRERRIEKYRKELRQVQPLSSSEYKINTQLYKEYKPYICDSAIHYQNKNIEIAIQLHDKNKEDESKLELAY